MHNVGPAKLYIALHTAALIASVDPVGVYEVHAPLKVHPEP